MNAALAGFKDFFSIALYYAPLFLPGIEATLQLSILSILFGTMFGLIINLMKMTHIRLFCGIADCYVALIRGTPLLLQLFFIYYGLPQIGITIDSVSSAALGLALHNGAYISEIFRGAIQSIDPGQNEAARAIGMNRLQAFRHVIFPQAFKNAVPALGNQFLLAIKDSSLASIITIAEIMTKAREFVAATYSVFPIYTDAAIFYMVLTYSLSRLLKLLEKKLRYSERRA